jgi:hypothetical protein
MKRLYYLMIISLFLIIIPKISSADPASCSSSSGTPITPVQLIFGTTLVVYNAPLGSVVETSYAGAGAVVGYQESSGWYRIALPNSSGFCSGWINGSAVKQISNGAQFFVGNTSGLGLRVRTGPSTSYPIITHIWDNEYYMIEALNTGTGCTNPWYEIWLPTDQPYSAGWVCGDYVTYVNLSSFSATSGNNQVTIQWQTSQENSNAGFYIYRSTDNVHYAKVNTTIIAPNQHNYTYTDTNVVNGTKYYYKLEDVSLSGAATMHNTIAWAIPSPADLDGNQVVDGNDLIILSQAMGSKPGMSNWNPKADLNGDGAVDANDLQILQQYFGDQLSGVAVAATVADSNVNSGLQPAQYENNILGSASLLPIANTNTRVLHGQP